MLIWVPANWVADGLSGLPAADVEVMALGRDMGQVGDIGDFAAVSLPPSVAAVEFFVPSFFSSAANVAAVRRMPRLRVVQTLTAGVEWLRPHLPPGVLLCNARGAHDAATAEWVVAAMLGALRGFPGFAREQAAGRWSYQGTDQLATKTVLIVGYGAIGAAVERRLAGFEVTVLRVARRARPGVSALTELAARLPEADVVVLLVPFTPQTAGLADGGFLAAMKDGALLVNAARGAVVNTDALVAEVASGRLRAALDVTDPEPLPSGHPLWSLPGVFITPHVAASAPVSRQRVAGLVRDQVVAYAAGEQLRNVISGSY